LIIQYNTSTVDSHRL